MSNDHSFKDKTVLITGGTGSFGRAMTRRLLTEDHCKKVIIFSRDEWKQWEIQQSDPIFRSSKIRFFLGDVRDRNRLERAFDDVDYVVHAAALKQVPAAEYNPSEFIKTNVLGAMNVIDAAITCRVQKVIALSSDKAVNPINLYGASKLCSDKLFSAGNSYVGSPKEPRFSLVRYGNVLGSRGSLIPHWQKLIDNGAKSLPITDLNMTRFWMSLDQSVGLVMSCFNEMYGGEIFVPKIPSMKIVDLANAMAPGLAHEVIGIRPGEKMHEVLLSVEDSRHALEFEKYFVILPEFNSLEGPESLRKLFMARGGKPLPENYTYTSGTNMQWLTSEELRNFLKTFAV
jgi:UDP-N-acetylglucosamine 4,6-dehydratase/5-epimerase